MDKLEKHQPKYILSKKNKMGLEMLDVHTCRNLIGFP